MDKNTAILAIGNLIEWLRQNRDLSETSVTDNELEALEYLLKFIIKLIKWKWMNI